MQKLRYVQLPSHALCVPPGHRADPSGFANTARCPEKKKCEGALREGLLQVGLQSFLQRGLAPKETLLTLIHLQRHPKTLRMTPQMTENRPK